MNLPVIFQKGLAIVRNTAGSGALLAKKHAPELMIAGGIVGFVVTIIETVKATNNTNDILQHKETRFDMIESYRADSSNNYTAEDYDNDIRSVNRQTKVQLVKTWAPVATTGLSSVAMVLGGYKILNGRYVATAAAYKALETFTDRYRGNVIEEFGKDTDWRLAHTIKAEELEARRREEDEEPNGKRKRLKRPKTAYEKGINNQIFDAHSDYWKRYWTGDMMLDFVRMVESQLQDKLNMNGHVFLNEAYDKLGLPRTAQGAIIGWINRPSANHYEKGNFLSLGFANDETPEEEVRRILSISRNDDLWCWITPNCDGVIYQMIDLPYSER